MSILENLYWGRNRAHVHDFFMTINPAVAKRFWLIPSTFRWVHGCILVLHGSFGTGHNNA